jgi:hypothetical protein
MSDPLPEEALEPLTLEHMDGMPFLRSDGDVRSLSCGCVRDPGAGTVRLCRLHAGFENGAVSQKARFSDLLDDLRGFVARTYPGATSGDDPLRLHLWAAATEMIDRMERAL